MKNMIKSVFIFMLLIGTAYAKQPSFDCSKAQSKVEHMICASPDLSNMDDAMAFSYLIAFADSKDSDKHLLAHSQSEWLKDRDRCQDEACVKDQYDKQLKKLDDRVCDFYTGGAMGDSNCSSNKLGILNKILAKLQKSYENFVMKKYDKPDNFEIQPEEVKGALVEEFKAWNNYITAKCWLYGIKEGGSFAWKNAFAQDCKVEETYKRISQLKAGSLD